MTTDESAHLITGLTRALARAGFGPPQDLVRLAGGANMESWRFRAGGADLVLRRAPSAAFMEGRQLDHVGEAALIRTAHGAGVAAPDVVAQLCETDGIGSGFVMRALPGTAEPESIFAGSDPQILLADIARELAVIHHIDPATLPDLPRLDPAEAVAALRARFLAQGGNRPVQALALRWLEANLPPPTGAALVHGDYRLGNLLVDDGRLSGVLDWELAHLGDPAEDLAYGCMTVWRFSRPDRAAFGLGPAQDLFAAYTAAGGQPVDPARFRFWLVYRTLWWAQGCLEMAGYWRSGSDRSLERVVVSRRCAEQELDLLVLLEADAPEAERSRPLAPQAPGSQPVDGEASAPEILTAVSEWLQSAVKPLVSGRGRFELAVARNALGIVTRELESRACAEDAELAARILGGIDGLATPGLLARLRRAALAKLAADMPKYPVLASVREAWGG